jgi:sterol desaturase/sphingolipid hydroxylase (fatty acid hydroxylase superfamily)
MIFDSFKSFFYNLLEAYYDFILMPFNGGEYLFWIYGVFYGLITLVIYVINTKTVKGFFGFLFPKDIYTHQSSKIDFYIMVLQPISYGLVVTPIATYLTIEISIMLIKGLNAIATSPNLQATYFIYFIFSILWLIAYDFAGFILHYYQHKIPALWEFHKIHHSAEVLNPVTAYRTHPLEHICVTTCFSVFTGLITAVFIWLCQKEIYPVMLFSTHIGLFLYYIAGYNFRHSHISIVYPKWLQYIFICPAQHQIHHSVEKKHWDKNIGYIFSVWDWLFGTLYIAKSGDTYQYGLSKTQDDTYKSLYNIYVEPFKNLFKMFKK